jgi:uncharacterized protein (DUF2252 family)
VTVSDRRAAGRSLRDAVPLAVHAELAPTERDPIAILEAQAELRHEKLIGIRYDRMAESPFGFLRGAAAVMAHDLSHTPVSGLQVQLCGDAHVRNFGKFATPERNLVFSINDFDETLPGPWEWDVKRLAASVHLVARTNGWSAERCDEAVVATVRSYRERLGWYARKRTLDLWYDHTSSDTVIAHFPKADRARIERDARKAMRKDHRRAVARYTTDGAGAVRFVDDPPLVVHLDDTSYDLEAIGGMLDDYRTTLPDDTRQLLDRFRIIDVAHRVGGVGSVGTRCWILLLEASDHGTGDHVILQVKEAQASVLEPYLGPSALGHHGRRVVAGQRLSQGATDVFLGWCAGPTAGRQYYVRQLWDQKGRSDLTTMDHGMLTYHGAVCGWALARSHARSGDAVQLAAYLGKRDTFDRAVAAYAAAYARVTDADHAQLLVALADGRVSRREGAR